MSAAADRLLADLDARGVSVRANLDGGVIVRPASALTAADRLALARHAPALHALVEHRTAATLAAIYYALTADERQRFAAELLARDVLDDHSLAAVVARYLTAAGVAL